MTLITGLLAIALLGAPGFEPAPASPVRQFAGSTPCDAEPRRFLRIPSEARCERITWQLGIAVYVDPHRFTLQYVYGMQAHNDPGFEGGGRSAQLEGSWSRVSPASAPCAAAYRLTTDDRQSLEVLQIGDNLLHLLN